MGTTIFYSWQADRPGKVCRSFIENSLKDAISLLLQDATLDEALRDDLVFDKDTQGVPGSPAIVETIFRKIDAAAVFVADLTFVGSRADDRPTPNPNVLIEYGWALSKLSHGRVLALMNTAFGEPTSDNLPFDLRHLRHPIQYHCPADANNVIRKSQQELLTKILASAIRDILGSNEYQLSLPPPPTPESFSPTAEISPGRFRSEDQPLGNRQMHPFGSAQKSFLAAGATMWLRVFPEHKQSKTWTLGELETTATAPHPFLGTLWDNGYSSFDYVRAPDGFGIVGLVKQEDATPAVTFAFRGGEVWTADACLLDLAIDGGIVSIPYVEDMYARMLDRIGIYLHHLGVEGPLRWEAGMTGVQDRRLEQPARQGHLSVPGPRGQALVET
ncbi:hypothetical protein [Burkholderia seminalis]|uniref:hypothetical protein n=1 Tax=Burkholderia seminalis TaxID=488731 RepID=UPI00158AB314|nr:hypothetical protein [Burkholderia seminalis]